MSTIIAETLSNAHVATLAIALTPAAIVVTLATIADGVDAVRRRIK